MAVHRVRFILLKRYLWFVLYSACDVRRCCAVIGVLVSHISGDMDLLGRRTWLKSMIHSVSTTPTPRWAWRTWWETDSHYWIINSFMVFLARGMNEGWRRKKTMLRGIWSATVRTARLSQWALGGKTAVTVVESEITLSLWFRVGRF